MSQTYALLNKTKGKLPRLPFEDMKDFALGKGYELSLVFISEKEMHQLNKAHRGMDKPTNVLSFELSINSGEVFLCPSYIKKEAPQFDRTFKKHVGCLFIHGLMHLKGYDHGSTMEAEELKIRKQFSI